jgi:hypothetical protein
MMMRARHHAGGKPVFLGYCKKFCWSRALRYVRRPVNLGRGQHSVF